MRRAVLLLWIAAVLVAGAATLALFGPPIPGPSVRSLLGLEAGLAPCSPTAEHVRLSTGAASPAGRWHLSRPFPLTQDELRAASVGDRIYVGSGVRPLDDEPELASAADLFSFDPERGAYRRLRSFPHPVDHPAIVAYRDSLYVAGGWVGGKPVAEFWRFSPAIGRWTRLSSMRIARGSPAADVIAGHLFVVGGSQFEHPGNPRPTAALEIYDFAQDRWSSGPAMPTPRHHHGAAAVGGRLYVVGGRGERDLSLGVVERFDPLTRRWHRLPSLPLGAGGVAVVNAGSKVVAIGGGDDNEGWVTPATWAFAPDRERWSRLADLNVARHGHGAAVAGGSIHVFGGAPCPGYGATNVVEALPVREIVSAP